MLKENCEKRNGVTKFSITEFVTFFSRLSQFFFRHFFTIVNCLCHRFRSIFFFQFIHLCGFPLFLSTEWNNTKTWWSRKLEWIVFGFELNYRNCLLCLLYERKEKKMNCACWQTQECIRHKSKFERNKMRFWPLRKRRQILSIDWINRLESHSICANDCIHFYCVVHPSSHEQK